MSLVFFSDPFCSTDREHEVCRRPFQQLRKQIAKTTNHVNLRMELKEHEDKFSLTVETPGLAKDEVKLSVEKGILTVSVEHKEEKEGTTGHVHFSERSYGSCSRSVRLPDLVDVNSISAEQDSGVLRISLPKTEAPSPQHIEIQ